LPLSCADCLEVWEAQAPGTLRACNGIALPLLYVFCIIIKTETLTFTFPC
jgi:hypothetical protein